MVGAIALSPMFLYAIRRDIIRHLPTSSLTFEKTCFYTPVGVTPFGTDKCPDTPAGDTVFLYASRRDVIQDFRDSTSTTFRSPSRFYTPVGVTSFRTDLPRHQQPEERFYTQEA